MWIRKSFAVAPYNLRSIFLFIIRGDRTQVNSPLIPNPISEGSISKYKCGFHTNQGLHLVNFDGQAQNDPMANMGKRFDEDLQPIEKPAYLRWTKWIFGAILSLFLPMWKAKWAQLLKLEAEAEMAIEIVENTAEAVEKVASATEKLSAEVAEKFSNEEKIEKAAMAIERVAEKIVKEAQLTEDIIHKVDDIKHEVEMLIDGRANMVPKEESLASDGRKNTPLS